jgi:hypothetical protein
MLLLALHAHQVFIVQPRDWLQCLAHQQTTVLLDIIVIQHQQQRHLFLAVRVICVQQVRVIKLFARQDIISR